jgi:hypothetical protein
MDGASAAAAGGTIATAIRNMHTSTPSIHLILFICSTFLLAAYIMNRRALPAFCLPLYMF